MQGSLQQRRGNLNGLNYGGDDPVDSFRIPKLIIILNVARPK
jgi:hypothetical protein